MPLQVSAHVPHEISCLQSKQLPLAVQLVAKLCNACVVHQLTAQQYPAKTAPNRRTSGGLGAFRAKQDQNNKTTYMARRGEVGLFGVLTCSTGTPLLWRVLSRGRMDPSFLGPVTCITSGVGQGCTFLSSCIVTITFGCLPDMASKLLAPAKGGRFIYVEMRFFA